MVRVVGAAAIAIVILIAMAMVMAPNTLHTDALAQSRITLQHTYITLHRTARPPPNAHSILSDTVRSDLAPGSRTWHAVASHLLPATLARPQRRRGTWGSSRSMARLPKIQGACPWDAVSVPDVHQPLPLLLLHQSALPARRHLVNRMETAPRRLGVVRGAPRPWPRAAPGGHGRAPWRIPGSGAPVRMLLLSLCSNPHRVIDQQID